MNFIDKILPGNYWITKSMEFVRVRTSGTLWYLKKWMTLYNYIFFKENLFEKDYQEIIERFDEFIQSLDPKVQANAYEFFYEIDIRGDFVTLSQFLQTDTNFSTEKEKNEFILTAKKFYFVYLMNIGGQSGDKALIKEYIASKGNYSMVLTELAKELAKKNKLNTLRMLVNDYHAALRNERQIFFYYGFFHGRESADLSGFYKLTNVGRSILDANADELSLIWEHQKLRMVSQSPITEINNLEVEPNNVEAFSILNHPYYTLLSIINSKGSISTISYQYVISKINNDTNLAEVIDNVIGNTDYEKQCIEKANSFGRNGDIVTEDFLKELKKYILGICELPVDLGTNCISVLSWIKDNEVKVINKAKLAHIVNNYKNIVDYLDKEYGKVYQVFNNALKEKYMNNFTKGSSNRNNEEAIYQWHRYIINFDQKILLSLIYLRISAKYQNYNYDLNNKCFEDEYRNYKNILSAFDINKSEFKELLRLLQDNHNQLALVSIDEDEDSYFIEDPREINLEVSENNLSELSKANTEKNYSKIKYNKERNGKLISLIRSFYIKNYIDESDNLIRCDCCMQKTFINTNNLPYLEFHHLIPFNTDNGPDHYLNIFGICPMCHRKMHFIKTELKDDLYKDLSNNNNFKKAISKRIELLYNENALEPLNIDFLRKEHLINDEQYEHYYNNMAYTE